MPSFRPRLEQLESRDYLSGTPLAPDTVFDLSVPDSGDPLVREYVEGLFVAYGAEHPEGNAAGLSDGELLALRGDVLAGQTAFLEEALAHAASVNSPLDNAAWGNIPAGSPESLQGLLHHPHEGIVYDIAASPDGSRFATAGQDGVVKIFDAQAGTLEHTLAGHTKLVLSLAFSADGATLATTGHDGTVRLWDPATGNLLRIVGIPHAGNDIQFSPDGGKIAVAVDNQGVTLVDLATGSQRALGGWSHFAFAPDGQSVVFGEGSKARMYSLSENRVVREFSHGAYPHIMAYSPDGRLLLTGGGSDLALWRTDTWAFVTGLGGAQSAAFSPDGTNLLVGRGDGRIEEYRVTGSLSAPVAHVQTLTAAGRPYALAVAPGAASVLVAGAFEDIRRSDVSLLRLRLGEDAVAEQLLTGVRAEQDEVAGLLASTEQGQGTEETEGNDGSRETEATQSPDMTAVIETLAAALRDAEA